MNFQKPFWNYLAKLIFGVVVGIVLWRTLKSATNWLGKILLANGQLLIASIVFALPWVFAFSALIFIIYKVRRTG